jgi:apolipoprotein N-acyltransferase
MLNRLTIHGLILNSSLMLASAALLVLSQSPYDVGLLATFALVPWLIATRRTGPVAAGFIGTAMGVVYAITGANWIFAAFDSQGVHGIRNLLSVLVVALWGRGLLFGGFGWLAQRLRGRAPAVQIALLGVFVGLAEFWISESRWGLPLLLLGHSQVSLPGVAQLAVVIGVPGISALLFALNVSIASSVLKDRAGIRRVAAWVAAWLSLAIGGQAIARCFESESRLGPKTLLIVQPNTPPRLRWDPAYQEMILDDIAANSARALEESERMPDVILWPENLLTVPVTADNRLGRRLQSYVDEWRVPVVTGLVRRAAAGKPGRYRNSVVWWSPQIGQRAAVDKVRAIPLIESGRDFWGRRALSSSIMGGAAKGPRVEEADEAGPMRGEFTISPVLCFEVLFPRIVAERRNDESVAIVNFADDSWVPEEVVDRQLVTAAAFRAIEQRLTAVRISHGGLSVVIDRFGHITASLEPDTDAHLFVEVAASPASSSFERAAILCLPVIAGLGVWCGWPASSPSLIKSGEEASRGCRLKRYPR